MIHQRQRLTLGFEARHDLARVHAQLDDLERNTAADRLFLLGHPYVPKTALADFLEQFVAADALAALLAPRQDIVGAHLNGLLAAHWLVNKRAGLLVRGEEGFDPLTELKVVAARLLEVGGPLSRIGKLQRGLEEFLLRWPVGVHGLLRDVLVVTVHVLPCQARFQKCGADILSAGWSSIMPPGCRCRFSQGILSSFNYSCEIRR